MSLYAIIRTNKLFDIDVMYISSYNDCESYLEKLKNDKKYDPYNEYHHKIEPVKKYKIIIEGE